MPTITIDLTDAQMKSLEYVAVSPDQWVENAVLVRAELATDEIINLLIKHCNQNNVQIASGEDAQVTQAYTLGVVRTAQAEADAIIAANGVTPA